MALNTQILGSVLIVEIDRPAQRNAVNKDTADALYQAFKDFDQDDALSVAILTGANDTFCAGADLHAFSDGNGNLIKRDGDYGPMGPTRLQLSKPVIAAIEGYAVAGGLELAVWADLRVASEDAVLGVFCRRFGVPLIDMGTVRLPRLIGQSRAADMILTGRAVDAIEAQQIGLVNRLAKPSKALETALALADEIANLPQTCMRSDRQSMLDQWSLNAEDAMKHEVALGIEVINSGEALEGAAAFKGGAGRHGTKREG